MTKNNVVNILLIVTVVLLLTLFAFAVRIAPRADHVVVLNATGMTGRGCGAKVADALRSGRGIAAVEVDMDRGRVIVGYDSGKTGPEAIASAVAGSGYRAEVAQLLDIGKYRALTGKNPGDGAGSGGCGCAIGRLKRSE